MGAAEGEAVLSVFWEGTANTISPPTTQVGVFAAACRAADVTRAEPAEVAAAAGPFKMAFDGCGVTHGIAGALFAAGLRGEAAAVAAAVDALVRAGRPVRCVAVGLSRGGIAAIFLAQALSHLPRGSCDLSLLLYDPVPGDALWTGFPFSGARARDVSGCAALRRVLALYPHEPLPDMALHAPLFVRYPEHGCDVEEDVTLGCHQAALGAVRSEPTSDAARAPSLSVRRIADFMGECGTRFSRLPGHDPDEAECVGICRAALRGGGAPTTRACHDGAGRSRTVVRRAGAAYLNRWHEAAERRAGGGGGAPAGGAAADEPRYLLDIEAPRPPPPRASGCSSSWL